jgi:hypothetical protein
MLELEVLPGEFSICRLSASSQVSIDKSSGFVSITRTSEELSIVCASQFAPPDCDARSDGWRCLRVIGVLDLALTGILASILSPLAASKISTLAIATYNTDYILVRSDHIDLAIEALIEAGIAVSR